MKTAVLTVGQIADQLGQPPARVAYVIAKHRLKPVGRVGIIRLFSEQQVETIKQAMQNHRDRTLDQEHTKAQEVARKGSL